MNQGEPTRPVIVLLGDSPDARLFVELSSHAADLTEAHHALELAIGSSRGDNRELQHATPYLVGFAVVAYCRTILHSNVRQRLTDHVRIPPSLLPIHDKVRAFRNATVAHSQSELAVTYPYVALDGSSLVPRYVGAMTVTNPLPETVVDEFRELVAALQDLLEEAINPVRERLMLSIMDADRAAMVAKGEKPNILSKMATEFDPRSRRSPYPDVQTVYWD